MFEEKEWIDGQEAECEVQSGVEGKLNLTAGWLVHDSHSILDICYENCSYVPHFYCSEYKIATVRAAAT